jgi:NodT family efflux transporter outer membrane factor (OMF) lipoprotein
MKRTSKRLIAGLMLWMTYSGCAMLAPVQHNDTVPTPQSYTDSKDTTNSADIRWRDFFPDKNLVSLIDTALKNNLELLVTLQNIEIARNEVRSRGSLLFPTVDAVGSVGVDKVGRYTSEGAGDAVTEMTPGHLIPDPLGDYVLGVETTWELDIWKKLRNSKKAAYAKYLGSVEGRNFVITNLVAEIADSYYELLALDNQLDIIRETIRLQNDALDIVKVQKEASEVTELAVKKFEAEVLNSRSREFEVLQQIRETENKINFLLGRYPQPIVRDRSSFMSALPRQMSAGVPSQLLRNRPDVRQASWELFASKCDVKEVQAEFYPSFTITGGLGFRAFNPAYLLSAPESIIYSFVGDLAAPLINRNAIKARFNQAKAYQLQAMYDYQRAVLNGYIEVSNELSNISNLQQIYDLKNQEVETLVKSIDIGNDLFKSARADYLEVLMTQRDALESKLELVEVKKRQFNAVIDMYRALGGGWK